MAVKIEFGIVCDDARREDNGKLIFVGVYPNSIIVPQLPAALILCLVLGVVVENEGEQKAAFRAVMGEKEILKGEGRMRASAPGHQLFPIKGLLLEIPEVGLLRFEISLDGEPWQVVREMSVTARNPIAAPST